MRLESDFEVGQVLYVKNFKENRCYYVIIKEIESWDNIRGFTYLTAELDNEEEIREDKYHDYEFSQGTRVIMSFVNMIDYKRYLQEQKLRRKYESF